MREVCSTSWRKPAFAGATTSATSARAPIGGGRERRDHDDPRARGPGGAGGPQAQLVGAAAADHQHRVVRAQPADGDLLADGVGDVLCRSADGGEAHREVQGERRGQAARDDHEPAGADDARDGVLHLRLREDARDARQGDGERVEVGADPAEGAGAVGVIPRGRRRADRAAGQLAGERDAQLRVSPVAEALAGAHDGRPGYAHAVGELLRGDLHHALGVVEDELHDPALAGLQGVDHGRDARGGPDVVTPLHGPWLPR